MRLLQKLCWRPSEPPAHFKGFEEFLSIWHELDADLRPSPGRRFQLELATMLTFDLRGSPPSWTAELYQVLAGLLAELRR